MARAGELRELVGGGARAVEAAGRAGLPTTVYLLAMALVEVKEAEAADEGNDGGVA